MKTTEREIEKIVYDILKSSGAIDIFPTPVDRIISFCELNVNHLNDFHKSIPSNYIAKNAEAFKRLLGKIAGVFDREEKIIYIDTNLNKGKQNFVKLHEVGHKAIPWQEVTLIEDDNFTLSPDVKESFEIEANFFASNALFQLDRFDHEISKLPLELNTIMHLANKFGASVHATARRYVEQNKLKCQLLILEEAQNSIYRDKLTKKGCFQSHSFFKEFGNLNWPNEFNLQFPFGGDYYQFRKFHQDGMLNNIITNNGSVDFSYHYFWNRYNVIVFIFPKNEKNRRVNKVIYKNV